MGKQLLEYKNVKEMYEIASQIAGYDLLQLCLTGPKEELDKTLHCQLAVVVTSLAAVERLKEENPEAIEQCVATAGFSVGEYAALVFAGALSFEDG
ncbi:malonyl-CoA-acyl carrier protein transacylase, mitochondrial-like [Centruroides sculpturatus]|uniref:malonyl-CoA-acyl carrier protein transacylase, mitochondrial-like n=1 Tax=Centruroides sculpturatus TaxID=218467 RepID=UPI000C6D9D90|nr:malonyl-CoA-acyl carrier protein transacylase, mitochondrial-like [Centruroides sculpturatus]